MTESRVYGIDLGTTYTCIARVDEASGRPQITPNAEGELTTPSVVLFEDAETAVVGREAKNTAVLSSDRVVEMIKRHMGESEWRRTFFERALSPEEISSYVLRKVVDGAEQYDGVRPSKVVITCPAYFDLAQREATAAAGRIAGLDVIEIINEPTAASILYGAQEGITDEVVLVYDLGGGTFDITVVEMKDGAIRVVATSGDDQLGGRDWDERVVLHAASRWKAEHPESESDPLDSPETVQDLWFRAESAKRALSSMMQTRIPVMHEAQQVSVTLTREEFDELTAPLLENTITFTKQVLEDARKLGVEKVDTLLLVGGSTRMPQVGERLKKEFNLPVKSFEPDHSVAKGAAIYGQKLAVGERIRTEIGKRISVRPDEIDLTSTPAEVVEAAAEVVASEMGLRLGTVRALENMVVTNVVSHSFGVMAYDQSDDLVIANLVLAQEPLPRNVTKTFGTRDDGAPVVELKIMETTVREDIVKDLDTGKEVGRAVLEMTAGLPAGSPIDVTFVMNGQGRLEITGRDKAQGGKTVTATFETNRVLSPRELEEAIEHAKAIRVIG